MRSEPLPDTMSTMEDDARALVAALKRERALAATQRSTQSSDDDLDRAIRWVDGGDPSQLRELVRMVTDRWKLTAELTDRCAAFARRATS